MNIIALYNIKGCVGKTAAAVNLALLAAREEAATLICDIDPQGSATYYYRIRPEKKFGAKKLLKGYSEIDRQIKGTDFDFLDLLPASLSFRNLDIVLNDQKRRKRAIHNALKPFSREYQYIFIDCPPNITLVSENIFRAADVVLVPVIPTTLSVLTYEKLLAFFKKARLNEKKIAAFFSMVERRKKLHKETMEYLQATKGRFLRTTIPYRADIEKMGIHREPIVNTKPSSPAAKAYGQLWAELKEQLG